LQQHSRYWSSPVAEANRLQRQRTSTPTPTDTPEVAAEKWRAKHDVDYRRDWVSIAGLFPLKAGINTAGSAPTSDVVLPASVPATVGRFVLNGKSVRFEPDPGAVVQLKDKPVAAPIELKDDSGRDSDDLVIGDVRVVVHVSGDTRSLRVRDPNGPLAKGFLGFTWFPIDERYRVVGRFIPDGTPKTMRVPNTYGDIDDYKTEGVVEFTLLGQVLRLRPFTTRPKRFYFVFRDESSGTRRMRPRASSIQICSTTAQPCWISILPTIRRARSIRTPRVRFLCARTACR
jgi:uncharacterized protein (DUF1684 family)